MSPYYGDVLAACISGNLLTNMQVNNKDLQQACPVPFDEGRMWKGHDAPVLRERLQQDFQNITRVMDCVGCEKCKLWGKLQILGRHPTCVTTYSCLHSQKDLVIEIICLAA